MNKRDAIKTAREEFYTVLDLRELVAKHRETVERYGLKNRPSKVNRNLTNEQALGIFEGWLKTREFCLTYSTQGRDSRGRPSWHPDTMAVANILRDCA